jgi:cob(I)alamin adenosyltransferase
MGHRLSRIVTRTGDSGTTGLGDGTRVDKDSRRIGAIGAVDELNANVGALVVEPLPETIGALLVDIQHDLFDLGGELSIPGHAAVSAAHVARLEQAVEKLNAGLPRLKEFILPGGTRQAALAHLARTVCRRAERSVIALAREAPVSQHGRVYLNRLSDLLFVLARRLNVAAGAPDILWQKDRARGAQTR